jgi:hypothetical protein
MGKPYADDLRLVVVRLIEEGHTRPEVAELCGISLSSVGRYIRRYRATGGVSPDKFGGYAAIRTMHWRSMPSGSSDGSPTNRTLHCWNCRPGLPRLG